MTFGTIIITVLGLALFEIVSSVDNAIVNAEVLGTMGKKAKQWFLFWGLIFAVFVVRGVLPWLIIWATNPSVGPWGAFIAAFSNDPHILESVEASAPILFAGGGTFLIFLFLHWLFMEPKSYGLYGEKFFHEQGVWFYAVVSFVLAAIVWFAEKVNPLMAFGAVVGSTAFFITHGFKQNAEASEKSLKGSGKSDLAKVFYLEIIDATFSIDGVLGAFAFTLSIPLILIGNGIGAIILRKLTLGNIDTVKKYIFLKNGAMYSIFVLGIVMLIDAFGGHIPDYVSPVITFLIVGYFFLKSKFHLAKNK
ncbi:MAG: DUF475 domain-containing protein [Patescibacteria group bacterium]